MGCFKFTVLFPYIAHFLSFGLFSLDNFLKWNCGFKTHNPLTVFDILYQVAFPQICTKSNEICSILVITSHYFYFTFLKTSSSIFQLSKKLFDINADIKNKIGHWLGRQLQCFCHWSLWKENWNILVLDRAVLQILTRCDLK